nr:fatty acid desaturase [Tatlockia sp.]
HCAQTNPLPTWLSFITCYHFGYHYEHHEHPDVPWWGLPKVFQMQREI